MLGGIAVYLGLWAFGAVKSNPYVPGTPGEAWNDEEVRAIREKVLVLVDVSRHSRILTLPPWEDQTPIVCRVDTIDPSDCGDMAAQRRPTEGKLLRLTFHDCFKYKDGTGGCDGCLNWKVNAFTHFFCVSADGAILK